MPNALPDLTDVLAAHPYPGRGVLRCRTADGASLAGYFLTGRSPASRARALRSTPDGALTVVPTDVRAHDDLRHYQAVRRAAGLVVYGNGEQVAAVADRLAAGLSPAEALDGLDYEPDPPIFTPRLTVVADPREDGPTWCGAARHSAAARSGTDRLQLRLPALLPGEGVLLTTYQGALAAPATGAPYLEAATPYADAAHLLDALWSALPPGLRVAAAVFAPAAFPEVLLRHATD
ncbi:IMP cyclohydrolase [Kitasatospora sp. NPDC088134]|uniref:IMP cyclohydrolase n=1 Tax=Kitasatospora sp. NPDC088134 TaxID=3364071 RepID=UPI0037F34BC4